MKITRKERNAFVMLFLSLSPVAYFDFQLFAALILTSFIAFTTLNLIHNS